MSRICAHIASHSYLAFGMHAWLTRESVQKTPPSSLVAPLELAGSASAASDAPELSGSALVCHTPYTSLSAP